MVGDPKFANTISKFEKGRRDLLRSWSIVGAAVGTGRYDAVGDIGCVS